MFDIRQPSTCDFYLIHHGHTNDMSPKDTRPVFESDPLSERGTAEMRTQAVSLKSVTFDIALCSNTQRTIESAGIILGSRYSIIKIDDKFKDTFITGEHTHEEVIKGFTEKTGYPSEHTKEAYPRIWEKYAGGPITDSNDCYTDYWNDHSYTFDEFSRKLVTHICEIAKRNIGKTVLICSHSTILKSVMSECKRQRNGIPTEIGYEPATGGLIHFTADRDGKFEVKEVSNDLKMVPNSWPHIDGNPIFERKFGKAASIIGSKVSITVIEVGHDLLDQCSSYNNFVFLLSKLTQTQQIEALEERKLSIAHNLFKKQSSEMEHFFRCLDHLGISKSPIFLGRHYIWGNLLEEICESGHKNDLDIVLKHISDNDLWSLLNRYTGKTHHSGHVYKNFIDYLKFNRKSRCIDVLEQHFERLKVSMK